MQLQEIGHILNAIVNLLLRQGPNQPIASPSILLEFDSQGLLHQRRIAHTPAIANHGRRELSINQIARLHPKVRAHDFQVFAAAMHYLDDVFRGKQGDEGVELADSQRIDQKHLFA